MFMATKASSTGTYWMCLDIGAQCRVRCRLPVPAESLDHFPPDHIRMPVFPRELRHHRPDVLRVQLRSLAQGLHRGCSDRRPVDEGNHGRIAAAIQHFAQSYLQGTELAAARVGIGTIEAPFAYAMGASTGFILPATTNEIRRRRRASGSRPRGKSL